MSSEFGQTAYLQGQATSDAAEQSADAIKYAADVQKQIYQDQVNRQEPFYQQGISSLEDYAKMLKGGYDMKQSPAAQYELQQGTKTMNRQLAARGLLGGGTAANRLTELSSGIAARDWQNSYARLLDSLKLGTGASAAMGQSGQTYGNQVGNTAANLGNIYTNQGNNMASIYQNLANTMNNTGASVGSAFIRNSGGYNGGYSGGGYSGGGVNSLQDYTMGGYNASAATYGG
ncbi:MAG: hypothetical protein WC332_02980 [Clostridia bacterium]|jgi:hypothetical protein